MSDCHTNRQMSGHFFHRILNVYHIHSPEYFFQSHGHVARQSHAVSNHLLVQTVHTLSCFGHHTLSGYTYHQSLSICFVIFLLLPCFASMFFDVACSVSGDAADSASSAFFEVVASSVRAVDVSVVLDGFFHVHDGVRGFC
jgi:hypothetical protein